VRRRTGELRDAARDRTLTYEVWAPEGAGPHELVLYSHSSYGHRAQSALLATRLAAHGYVVASADHAGNTRAEWGRPRATPMTPEEREAFIAGIIADRVPDLRALADRVLADGREDVDRSRMGLVGWSFGGWAMLATPEQDDRFSSIVAFAPGGSERPLPNIIPSKLTFKWTREIPVLYLAADRDQFIPLDRVTELYDRTASPKRMFVLRGADHGHFNDEVTSDLPASAESAHLFRDTLTLAHLDATLRGDGLAQEVMMRFAVGALRDRGVDAFAYPG